MFVIKVYQIMFFFRSITFSLFSNAVGCYGQDRNFKNSMGLPVNITISQLKEAF